MSLLDLFSEPVCRHLTWTLLHFLWQGLAVAAITAALLHAGPVRRASHRYTLYLAALVAMAACPVVTFLLTDAPLPPEVLSYERETVAAPALVREPAPEPAVTGQEPERADIGPFDNRVLPEPVSPSIGDNRPWPDSAGVAASPTATSKHDAALDAEAPAHAVVPPDRQARLQQYFAAIQPYSLIVWLAGVLLLAVRLSLSWLHVRRLIWDRKARRAARPAIPSAGLYFGESPRGDRRGALASADPAAGVMADGDDA